MVKWNFESEEYRDRLIALASAHEHSAGLFTVTELGCHQRTRQALERHGLVRGITLTPKGVEVRRAYVLYLIGWTPADTRKVEDAYHKPDSHAAQG